MTKQHKPNIHTVPHQVVALIYDGLCTFEFGIAAEVFGLARPELGPDLYHFNSVSLENGPLSAAGGLRIEPTATMAALKRADTIIIPGWRGKDTPVPDNICQALKEAADKGVRLVSICSGVYVLAAAGLLNGKGATTHWRYTDDLARRYPQIDVQPNALYVDTDNIITSAGSSAGIDACLHIVRSDFGANIASAFARRLVMHAHRQGDQAQYIEQAIPKTSAPHKLSEMMDKTRGALSSVKSVSAMSSNVGMSPRTFQRQFTALTGLAPMKWLIQERLTRAQFLLETTTLPIDDISLDVGFENTEALRYHFRKKLRMSPLMYRKRFSQSAELQVSDADD